LNNPFNENISLSQFLVKIFVRLTNSYHRSNQIRKVRISCQNIHFKPYNYLKHILSLQSMSSQTNYYYCPQQQTQQQQALTDERRRYCVIHPYAECVFLCTDPSTTDSPFKCDLCFFEQNLTPKYLIPIKQIQRSDSNTILWNWPLPDEDSLLQQVKAVTSQPRSDTDLRDKFRSYFKEFRLKINQKIDELEEATN